MTAAGIAWVKFTTVVLFVSFVLMIIILYLPFRHKPYKDAEKLALKDEDDAPINPRHSNKNHKRQEP
ncbi:MAG: cbb3-type cytochrome c oxidase subunit 3 [Cardiobacteriaceae bacterium]|nr:cbb3-type cytochrome c oxidase subunit 3 [Cardiobacteriaceae bacterium]